MTDSKKGLLNKLNRRSFLRFGLTASSLLSTGALYRYFRGTSHDKVTPEEVYKARKEFLEKPISDFSGSTPLNEELTSFDSITTYNNFYEFSTDKEAVAKKALSWRISDWQLEIGGLVENPLRLNLSDIYKIKTEDRIYRFRCVEGWSMVIPWNGFPLSHLLEKAKPKNNAKYVAFESYFNESDMPSARLAGIPFPYTEGLRLDEALNPLTLMATGLYQKKLPPQNGTPIRLVVPWKYGFKSIKSVAKIWVTEDQPATTWNLANPQEYGFYSNVNPEVDHPRWSQKKERRIGEFALRETQMFNGYEKQVAHLYKDLDLRKNF